MTNELLICAVTIELEINDASAIARCTENAPVDPDTPDRGWRDTYYDLRTRQQVLEHFAFNCIANGIEDASRLDGWADLPEGAVTMTLKRRALEFL